MSLYLPRGTFVRLQNNRCLIPLNVLVSFYFLTRFTNLFWASFVWCGEGWKKPLLRQIFIITFAEDKQTNQQKNCAPVKAKNIYSEISFQFSSLFLLTNLDISYWTIFSQGEVVLIKNLWEMKKFFHNYTQRDFRGSWDCKKKNKKESERRSEQKSFVSNDSIGGGMKSSANSFQFVQTRSCKRIVSKMF